VGESIDQAAGAEVRAPQNEIAEEHGQRLAEV
jgi:hypothetical protein